MVAVFVSIMNGFRHESLYQIITAPNIACTHKAFQALIVIYARSSEQSILLIS